jgi:hypothetical protein
MRRFVPFAFLVLGMTVSLAPAQNKPPARTPVEQKALAKIQQLGGLALELAQNDNRLEVSYLQHDQKFSDDFLIPLKDLKGLVHLNLRGQDVTDAQLAHLKDLTSLTRLHLEKTKITDKGLAQLKGLTNLEYLNVYGTAVTDAGLSNLAGMKKLKNLYVWQTKVTEAGAGQLKKQLPQVEVVLGFDFAKPKEETKVAAAPAKKDDKVPVKPVKPTDDKKAAQAKPNYPPAPAPRFPQDLGQNVQRTMTLLATSTPQHRNKVRILFYGQSITEQDWWKRVADDLKKRFPNADVDIQNKAIGGFTSERLIRPAEHDVYPFYPDLVIFHVYGSSKEYEQIIQNIRSRTTAEVLMQTDHAIAANQLPGANDQGKDSSSAWDSLMNYHTLPRIAQKHGCGLVDVRGGWIDYLKANKLEPKALLSDTVHLNDHGNFLMAELVKQYLVYRPDLASDRWLDSVRTFTVGRDVNWQNGKLALEFEGNRVDLIASPTSDGKAPAAKISVDGKKPSEFPALYAFSRPTPGPWSPLAVTRVDWERPLQIEDWTLKIDSVAPDGKSWKFHVEGSKTGNDGSGSNTEAFVSKSGRVKIDPAAWFRNDKIPIPTGYAIQWKVVPLFADTYTAAKADDASREAATTAAQGLRNARHRLEITADGKAMPAIQAIRVYRPMVK